MDKTGSQISGSYWSLCGLGGNSMGHLQLVNIPVGKTGPWMRGSCGPDGNSLGHLQLLDIPVGKTGPWMRGSKWSMCRHAGNSLGHLQDHVTPLFQQVFKKFF